MEILDGRRHDKAGQRWELGWIVRLLNGGKHWAGPYAPDIAENYTASQIKQADVQFTDTLRALVDQWIDSGKAKNGIERPLARDISKAPPAGESLFDILHAWLGRNMPTLALQRNGKIAISSNFPIVWAIPSKAMKYDDPRDYAKECAIFYLKELLDTPGAHRVSLCKNPECSNPYYLRRRVPRKAEIKRGTYCSNCAGVGSVGRTRISREARKQKLVNLAAEFWDKWKPERRYGRRADWVATRMNSRSDSAVTGKWVNQNLEAIELELKRRTNAKS